MLGRESLGLQQQRHFMHDITSQCERTICMSYFCINEGGKKSSMQQHSQREQFSHHNEPQYVARGDPTTTM
jgi:hypothetical protein